MYTVYWRGIILTAILPALIQLKHDFATTDISDKMKALLSIAASVQKSVKDVTLEQIEHAKSPGVIVREIPDTVLIAAAFCMVTGMWMV